MFRFSRRRRRRRSLLTRLQLEPRTQVIVTIICAVLFAGLVFSEFLLFRFSERGDLIERGKRLMYEGKVAWAAKTFQILVNRHPDDYEGHLLLGQTYLELEDRRKAEQEFKIASSIKIASDPTHSLAEVALSRLEITRKNYELAETKLLELSKKNPKNPEIRDSLFSLYDQWGDNYLLTKQDTPNAILKYDLALPYASDYNLETRLKDKLMEAARTQADKLITQGKSQEGINLLEQSLRYRYLPSTLSRIAKFYEQKNQLGDAIYWYRKAFNVDPAPTGLLLSKLLMRQGRELTDKKKPEEANAFFEEAKEVSRLASIPISEIYPVGVKTISLVPIEFDLETNEFLPKATIAFENKADRELSFLLARITYFSGNKQISQLTKAVASPENPLPRAGDSRCKRNEVIAPTFKFNLPMLEDQQIRIKVSIAYSDDPAAEWLMKSIYEGRIRKPDPPKPIEEPKEELEVLPSKTEEETETSPTPAAPSPAPQKEAPSPIRKTPTAAPSKEPSPPPAASPPIPAEGQDPENNSAL
jgi:Tfp pilus assembly protein PilF